ncbi:MAG: hypothetical protein R3C11_05030 [Planctomycetaceae bacterium]
MKLRKFLRMIRILLFRNYNALRLIYREIEGISDEKRVELTEILKGQIAAAELVIEKIFSKEGDPALQYNKAILLLDGDQKEVDDAIKLLTLSADNGFSDAQYLLGMTYFTGVKVETDYSKAYENLKRNYCLWTF